MKLYNMKKEKKNTNIVFCKSFSIFMYDVVNLIKISSEKQNQPQNITSSERVSTVVHQKILITVLVLV